MQRYACACVSQCSKRTLCRSLCAASSSSFCSSLTLSLQDTKPTIKHINILQTCTALTQQPVINGQMYKLLSNNFPIQTASILLKKLLRPVSDAALAESPVGVDSAGHQCTVAFNSLLSNLNPAPDSSSIPNY